MKKILHFVPLLSAAAMLMSCGGSNNANCEVSSVSVQPVSSAKVTNAFISTAKMSYSNMRPTYNYYLTTFTFETLELLDDNSYILTISSSTFSAVILPEEGNAATGNERNNSLVRYAGKFTSQPDDLDPETLIVTCGEVTRIMGIDDEKGYVDTDNWTSNMKSVWADEVVSWDVETGQKYVTGKTEYNTGAEYLAAHMVKIDGEIYASTKTGNMEWVDVVPANK